MQADACRVVRPHLIENGAKVILCSHLGKPVATFDGYVKKQVEKGKNAEDITKEEWEKSLKKLTLAPVAKRLSELLGQNVVFANDDNVVGENAKAAVAAMKDGDVVLLQNTRFRAEETKKRCKTVIFQISVLSDTYSLPYCRKKRKSAFCVLSSMLVAYASACSA